MRNVTLRDVSKELGISYGNVTYHFKSKQVLLEELYQDMLVETKQIMSTLDVDNLLEGILLAPRYSFKVSMKFLFFYVDYVELRRKYSELFKRAEKDNELRKAGYLQLLLKLQSDGILRGNLTPDDLDYLMDLSGSMRTFFFINLTPEEFELPDLEEKYVSHINRLLIPYLSDLGLKMYSE